MSGRDTRVRELEGQIGVMLAIARTGQAEPPRVAGRYEVRAILGTGAFGTVVRAWDPTLDREVAIKCIPASDPDRWLPVIASEARAQAQPKAPEIVEVFDVQPTYVGVADSRTPCVAIVMEYVPGVSLRKWLGQAHDRGERLEVLISAARGLEAAHATNLVHRDFKPENVMISGESRARLVDFGLAYQLRRTTGVSDLAERRHFGVGTSEYMAPEVSSEGALHHADQFAYALTAWEVLTGVRPFAAQSSSTWARMDSREFAGAGRLSRALRKVLSRGLRYSPSDRFESMEELRLALEQTSRSFAAVAVAAVGLVTIASSSFLVGKRHERRNK